MVTSTRAIQIDVGDGAINGDLVVPEHALGVIVFAHGSGSSRHSPRNRGVAAYLQQRRFATLLIDLLTAEEERIDSTTGQLRFDIELLADRLCLAEAWVAQDPETAHLPVGYFGASTGGGAALVAAVRRPERVFAVVSRGGRPDLAGDALHAVRAPTLLIVGGRDTAVIAMNRAAHAQLNPECRLAIVEGATHLFEEPGALEEVARLAGDWFTQHVSHVAAPAERRTP